ncbi:MAG: metallophosphoesterase family protein, partial [Planctomycetota bacterium]
MSFEPIFVFAADLHLRPRTWTRHPDLQGDAYASLNYIAAYCRDMRLPLVLGGDIFNSRRPDPLSVTRFNSVLGANDGCRVYYVQGNHDACGESPWPGVAGWGYPLHNRTVTLRDRKEGNNVIRVHGLDWTPREKLQEALAAVPTDDESPFAAVDVLVCHQSWSELQGIG